MNDSEWESIESAPLNNYPETPEQKESSIKNIESFCLNYLGDSFEKEMYEPWCMNDETSLHICDCCGITFPSLLEYPETATCMVASDYKWCNDFTKTIITIPDKECLPMYISIAELT